MGWERRYYIELAIGFAGSEAALAEATGYSQNAIWAAKQRGLVTAEMALAIDRALHGAVSASDLRPDLWPTPLHVPEKIQ